MKPLSLTLALLGVLLAGLPAQETESKSATAAPPQIQAAVFDFSEGADSLKGQGETLGKLLNAALSTKDGIYLVERAELDKILSEQELSLSGATDDTTAVKIGKLCGAQVLITGRMFEVGDQTHLVAKIMSAETSRVYGSTVHYKSGSDLTPSVAALAQEISALILKHGGTLVSQPESWEALVSRLKAGLVGETPLPAVHVQIKETHLRGNPPDPACETEMIKLIGAVGFPLAKSREEARIAISGEAFSQFATRRGNLVACRARAEIKIEEVPGHKLIRSDRRTVGALDLGEEIAGKSALQQAGRQLAESFITQFKH